MIFVSFYRSGNSVMLGFILNLFLCEVLCLVGC